MAVAGACAATAIFLGPGDSAEPKAPIYGIPGQYVPVTNLRPHAYDRLQVDVYADFTCPACQRLETQGLGALEKRYGDRLRITRHYMAVSPQASAGMVLYQLADGLGKGDVVAQALMSSNLKHAGDRVNLEAVRQVAGQFGLLGQFDQAYASD